jgi:multiple sugar transport system permease protein
MPARKARSSLVYVLLVVTGIVVVFPFAWMLSSALQTPLQLATVPIQWFPTTPDWKNFSGVFDTIPLARMFANSFIVTVTVSIGIVATSLLAGFALAKYRFPGRGMMFFFTLATMFVPYFILMIPLYYLMRILGWLDTYQGLIVPNLVTGFGIFMMRQFMITIPDDVLDAARIDGSSEGSIFWRIAIPAAKPGIAALGIFAFVYQWSNFLWPLLVVSATSMMTVPLGLEQLSSFESTQQNMGLVMAGTAIAVIPSTLVFIALQRYFVEGINLSGVKG